MVRQAVPVQDRTAQVNGPRRAMREQMQGGDRLPSSQEVADLVDAVAVGIQHRHLDRTTDAVHQLPPVVHAGIHHQQFRRRRRHIQKRHRQGRLIHRRFRLPVKIHGIANFCRLPVQDLRSADQGGGVKQNARLQGQHVGFGTGCGYCGCGSGRPGNKPGEKGTEGKMGIHGKLPSAGEDILPLIGATAGWL